MESQKHLKVRLDAFHEVLELIQNATDLSYLEQDVEAEIKDLREKLNLNSGAV